MAGGLFLGIDHGGSTTTALLFDPEGGAAGGKLASRSVRMPKRMPAPGWVEHDAEDFLATSLAAAKAALLSAGRDWRDVAAIGIANQGETSIAWSAGDGRAVAPAISWEDRRTQELCAGLAARGVDRLVGERTGVLLDPYFSASKYAWLLREAGPGAGRLRLGGTDVYVMARLTGNRVHATDLASASRTALLNLREGAWDGDLLDAFEVPRETLARLLPTCGRFGEVDHPDVAARGIEITADAVDAHAALFAQGAWDGATAKATYGTGAFIEVNTGEAPAEADGRLLVLIGWEIEGRREHLLEGGVFAVGSAVDWAVRLGWLPSAAASGDLAASAKDASGVTFVPCLTGLAAPHWDPQARAAVGGLGLDSGPAEIARALLDGIAFQCAEVVQALDRRLGGTLRLLRADGGPTRNAYLMQRQADLLGLPVGVTDEPDMTALGAALLAAIGAGAMTRSDAAAFRPAVTLYEPRISEDRRGTLWAGWQRSIAWAQQMRGA